MMQLEVLRDAEHAAARAAEWIAAILRDAISRRGFASLALSGGTTPPAMLGKLASLSLSWTHVHIFQVDERVVPAMHASRNLRHLLGALSATVESNRIHAMPVEESDLDSAAVRYVEDLCTVAGKPPVLDLVHLGLGTDGHTASLMSLETALAVGADVLATHVYDGSWRMTLTLAPINRARRRMFLVTGASKRAALQRLMHTDRSMVATHVATENTLIIADEEAASSGYPKGS